MLTNYNNTVTLSRWEVLVQNGLFTPDQLGVGDTLCYSDPTICRSIRYAWSRLQFPSLRPAK